mmetsp:Transcript_76185/g.192639  ORF Transcript_76185/g.192639 Transcript_76185/m.192639 type:complete len:211 (+) Transcript_76185:3192-3824(+)
MLCDVGAIRVEACKNSPRGDPPLLAAATRSGCSSHRGLQRQRRRCRPRRICRHWNFVAVPGRILPRRRAAAAIAAAEAAAAQATIAARAAATMRRRWRCGAKSAAAATGPRRQMPKGIRRRGAGARLRQRDRLQAVRQEGEGVLGPLAQEGADELLQDLLHLEALEVRSDPGPGVGRELVQVPARVRGLAAGGLCLHHGQLLMLLLRCRR